MLVGYARVSSAGQSLEVQLEQLKEAGCEKVFAEKKSGRKADNRAELQSALEFVREGDVLVVTRLDRLARSVDDLRKIVMETLGAKGVGFRCIAQGALDTTRAEGRLFLTFLAAFAEFEADIRRDRQLEGIAKAKAEHPERYTGRPAKIDKEAIRALYDSGLKPPQIAQQLQIGLASVYRALPPRREQAAP
jgi:DNA invertase Pin-like site-specific DNA recombinase